MSVLRFDRWCALAVSEIRFKPDRKAVYEELYAHMEDQYEELTAEGVSEKEAEEEVAEAMGDPGETAQQLARIHRPFWGYALRAARICLIVSAILALLILPRYIRELVIREPPELVRFTEDVETEEYTDRLVYSAEPQSRAKSDGYTFTLTRAAERHSEARNGEWSEDELYFLVEVFNPRPWAESSEVLREFCAVDSLGNVYGAYNLTPKDYSIPALTGNPTRTGLLTWTWVLWLRAYRSQEAEWIELRYDQSGRDVRLIVDLRDRKGAGA